LEEREKRKAEIKASFIVGAVIGVLLTLLAVGLL